MTLVIHSQLAVSICSESRFGVDRGEDGSTSFEVAFIHEGALKGRSIAI